MYLHKLEKTIEFQRHKPKWSDKIFVRFCLDDTRGQYLALNEGFTCFYYVQVLTELNDFNSDPRYRKSSQLQI